MIKKIWQSILFNIFLWSGAKLFPTVSIYCPTGEDGDVEAIYFAIDEEALTNSTRDYVENSLK